jgi:triosephosphate isomerase
MNQKFLAFNWKMNPSSQKEALNLFYFVYKYAKKPVVLAVPFIYIPVLYQEKSKNKVKNISLASQDAFGESVGAFTGAISPKMLLEFGVSYSIVGHSERRYIFNENDKMIASKIKSLSEFGICPILCVGERKKSTPSYSWDFVRKQLDKDLNNFSGKNLIVAYEPVWSIGGNKPTNANHSYWMISKIKSYLENKFKLTPLVLYGGSVNCKNIDKFLQYKEIDGFLVGSSSLKKDEILCIINKTII